MNAWAELTLKDLADGACGNLPDGYSIIVRFSQDELCLDLIDPLGRDVEVQSDDLDGDLPEMIFRAVNEARTREKMEPIEREKIYGWPVKGN
jgi:hypothetical protein